MSLAISSTIFSSSADSGGYLSLNGRQTHIMILIGSGIKLSVRGKYGAWSNFTARTRPGKHARFVSARAPSS
jgi:hypothetical protein